MKKISLMIVVITAIMSLSGNYVSSAEHSLRGQDQIEVQQDGNKAESPQKVSGALGTKTNPVRCDAPKGERQYLSRLRCSDDSRPVFSRIGSFGVGPYGNIIDGYRVKCGESDEVTVYMDMYHEDYVEKEAVPGFTIVD